MALQKQTVPLLMKQGVDTKTDRGVMSARLTRADDVLFDDGDTIKTRWGQTQVTLPTGVSEVAHRPMRAFTVRGAPYIETDQGLMARVDGTGLDGGAILGTQAASLDPTLPSKFPRASAVTRRIQSLKKKRVSLQGNWEPGEPLYDLNFDAASDGYGVYCLAWEEPGRGSSILFDVRISIRNEADDSEIAQYVLTHSGDTLVYVKPRVVYFPDVAKFAVFAGRYAASGATNYEVVASLFMSDGTTASPSLVTVITTEVGTQPEALESTQVNFDVSTVTHGMVSVAAVSTGHAYVHTCQCNSGLSVTAYSDYTPSLAPPANAVAAAIEWVSGVHYISYFAVATGYVNPGASDIIEGFSVDSVTGTPVGAGTLYSSALTTVQLSRMVLQFCGSHGLVLVATYHDFDTDQFRTIVGEISVAFDGPVIAVNTECEVAGRPFQLTAGDFGGRWFLPLLRGGQILNENIGGGAMLVADLDDLLTRSGDEVDGAQPHYIARLDVGEAYRHSVYAGTQRIPAVMGSTVLYPKFETDQLITGGFDETAICIVAATLDMQSQLGFMEVNGTTFLAGAAPLLCDGAQVVEEGFNFRPEIRRAPAAGTLAALAGYPNVFGPFAANTYSCCFTEAWQDAAGNWHESAPSNVEEFTTAGADLYVSFNLSRPTSLKDGSRRRLLMYRTLGNSTDPNFYSALRENNVAVTDTEIQNGGSEVLYTVARPQNDPAPACRHVSWFQRRLVLTGCGDGSVVYWSQQSDPGYGVGFNSTRNEYQQTVPERMGKLVGSSEMNGNLVLLGEEQIGVIAGQGPDTAGVGEYTTVETVVADMGCDWDSPRSIALDGDGVWFRAAQGIRLFGRGGAIARGPSGAHLGSEVDEALATISSTNLDDLMDGRCVTVLGSGTQLARFFANGHCFVYDSQFRQWTRFTQHNACEALYAGGRFLHVSYNATAPLVRYYDTTSQFEVYDDGSTETTEDVPTTLTVTGIIETSWLQFAGLAGFQRVYQAVYSYGHRAYSGSWGFFFNAYAQYDFVESDVGVDTLTATAPDVTTGRLFQFRHKFSQQKCEAIRLRVEFSATGSPAVLTGITLEVGVKGRPFPAKVV